MVGFPKFSQFWKFLGFHSGGFGAPSCTWVKPLFYCLEKRAIFAVAWCALVHLGETLAQRCFVAGFGLCVWYNVLGVNHATCDL